LGKVREDVSDTLLNQLKISPELNPSSLICPKNRPIVEDDLKFSLLKDMVGQKYKYYTLKMERMPEDSGQKKDLMVGYHDVMDGIELTKEKFDTVTCH
jgi:hypothetical protein